MSSSTLTGLKEGIGYYVRLIATNNTGSSFPAITYPQHVTRSNSKSSQITKNKASILVTYDEVADENGAKISAFIVEMDVTPNFLNPSFF